METILTIHPFEEPVIVIEEVTVARNPEDSDEAGPSRWWKQKP